MGRFALVRTRCARLISDPALFVLDYATRQALWTRVWSWRANQNDPPGEVTMAYDALRAEYCRYAARQVWWACRAALCLDTISHTHSHLLPKAWCVLSLEFGLAIYAQLALIRVTAFGCYHYTQAMLEVWRASRSRSRHQRRSRTSSDMETALSCPSFVTRSAAVPMPASSILMSSATSRRHFGRAHSVLASSNVISSSHAQMVLIKMRFIHVAPLLSLVSKTMTAGAAASSTDSGKPA